MSGKSKGRTIFQGGEFHGWEYAITVFDDGNLSRKFITLPAIYLTKTAVVYRAVTYRWTGERDEKGRFIFSFFTSKYLKTSEREYLPKRYENAELEEVAKWETQTSQ
jgi:hypothetical protein